MSQFALDRDNEELGYEVDARHGNVVISERRGLATSRQLNGQERRSRQARYSRQSAPVRLSGSHRRRNKHNGL